MTVVKITGGLGNQLFQYAAARKVGLLNKTKILFDLSYYQHVKSRKFCLDRYNIEGRFASKIYLKLIKSGIIPHKTYTDTPFQYNQQLFNPAKHVYLDGYWSDEYYFHGISDILLGDMTLKHEINVDIMDEAKKCESVSVHIRRTDYLSMENKLTFYELNDTYYSLAINYIIKNVASPKFFIFSDDINHVIKSMKCFDGLNVKYVISNEACGDVEQFEIMRSCNHNIIANSTFSWWAAWLNSNPLKIVIAPSIWYSDNQYQSAYGKTLLRTSQKWIKL